MIPRMEPNLQPVFCSRLEIRPAALGNDADVIGYVSLAMDAADA